MKKIVLSIAVLLGAATISFAGNPKVETKATNVEGKSDTKVELQQYWYEVTYDVSNPGGYISATATPQHVEKSQVVSDCNPGADLDCMRGFNAQPALPTTALGDDQITKSEN